MKPASPVSPASKGKQVTKGALARQWELLRNLPRRGTGRTTKELTDVLVAAGFNVSKRQVERDLSELNSIFPLHCNDRSRPYGWRWADHASLDLPGITVAEAVSLKVAQQYLATMLPPAITSALQPKFIDAENKLAALDASNPNAEWATKVRSIPPGPSLTAAPLAPEVLDTVQESLLFDEQLEVLYRAGNGKEATTLVLHPLALISRAPAAYLVATAFDYTDIRRYKLHRIESAKRTYLPSRRPNDFDLDTYLNAGGMEFGDGEQINLEALVSPGLALILSETPLSGQISLTEENGKFRLKSNSPSSWQLRWWILSQGDQIEVLSPPELRSGIIEVINRTASLYSQNEVS